MTHQILFGSTNRGKAAEMQLLARALRVSLCTPAELATVSLPIPIVEEDGASYEENARKKAEAFGRWAGCCALGDDTGLEVRALGGAPGIHSARYAGEGAGSAENVAKLLAALHGVHDRSAQFVCVLVLWCGPQQIFTAQGVMPGKIAYEPRGGAGFGYDCVFVPEGEQATLAELKEVPPVDTHRARAMRALFERAELRRFCR